MSAKVASVLAAQQKSFEALKKKADLFLKEFKKFKKSKKNRDELSKYSDRCKELLLETDTLLEEAEEPLDEEEDAKRRKSFETKKKHLVGKINSLREQLTNVQETISATPQAEDDDGDKTSPTDVTQNEETTVKKSSKSLSAKVRESFRFDRSKKNKKKKEKEEKNGEGELKEEKPEPELDENDLVEDLKDFKDDVKDIEDVDDEEEDEDEEEEEEESEEEESEEEKEKVTAAAVVVKSPSSQTEKPPETEEKTKKEKIEEKTRKEKNEEKTKKEKIEEKTRKEKNEEKTKKEKNEEKTRKEKIEEKTRKEKNEEKAKKEKNEDKKQKEIMKTDTVDSEKLKSENMAEDATKVPVKKPFLQKFLPNKRKTTETKEKAPIPEPEISTPKAESTPQNGEKATVTEKETDIVVAPKPVPRTTGKKKSPEENQKSLVPSESLVIQETKKSAGVLEYESKAAVKPGEKLSVEDDDDDEEEDEEESEEEEEEDDDEEEEESEEEEEEEGEEEEEEDDDLDITGKQFIALQDFAKQEKNDLAFKKKQVLTILRANEDGWWDAMDTSGNKGLVPKTYLRLYPAVREKGKPRQKIEEDDDDDEEEDDDDDDEEEEEDDDDEEEEEEEEDEDEDEDEEDDNSKVVKNGEASVINKNQSGKKLWKALQKSVTETSIIDVLHGMGAVPSGFRSSTLASLYHTNHKYRMSHSLHPKLSTSALNFKDMFYSPSENKIRPYSVNIQRIVTLISCRYIPTIGARLEMIKRTVRVCLFNGKNILSNIHVIKTFSVDKSQRTWNFSSNLSNNTDVSQHAEIFVRTNHTGPNVSLLFELGITYIHTETKERGEFSSGWQLLPLNVENVTLPNQNYDLYLQGGTPYERGVPLDDTASRAMEENTLRNMIYGHQKPMLNIKVVNPKREQKELLDCLPETIIGNVSLLPFYSIYRNILARSLLWDRPNIDNTELLHSPILSTFPIVADQYELMQLLRDTWTEKQRELTRGSKRDDERQKKLFVSAFMEAVYPMSHSLDFSGSNGEAQRYDALQKFKNLKTERQSALAILLSEDIAFEPLDLEEVTFSIMHPFSLQEG